MQTLITILPYVQIALAVSMSTLILLQKRGAGVGGAFGGGDSFGFNTRRGAEKIIFNITVLLAVIFVLSTILSLVLNS